MRPHDAPLSRRAALSGAVAAAAIATPAHAQIQDLLKRLPKTPTMPAPPKAEATPAADAPKPGVQAIEPRGYSQDFIPIRDMICAGHYTEAMGRFPPLPATPPEAAVVPDAKPAKRSRSPSASAADPTPGRISNDPYLSHVELGLMALENGAPDLAVTHLRQAEDVENTRREATGMKAVKGKAGDLGLQAIGLVSGQKGITRYNPLDHERVLQLNYLSLAYLLQGDRRSYNITRRCIDEQGLLKAKFDKELSDYKAKYAQQTGDGTKVTEADRQAIGDLSDQFNAYKVEAGRVPNAYVNPLGDYLAGVIQEIASREQPALRDNSRIAYDNAGKLCGRPPQLGAAAKAMARPRVPANERVLHVIAGEGFSPQREVMTFGLNLRDQVVPVRVPIFRPVGTPIQRIAVLDAKGAQMAVLDPIGDFEAIRLRDQQDRTPQIMLDVVANTLASYFTGQATAKMGFMGTIIRTARESTASPDTRSWLSLPRRFHVARVVLPANARNVQIAAFAPGGRRLGVQAAEISTTETQSILYARVTPDAVRVQTARRLWIDGQLDQETTA
jgi:hypothetical protein